VGKRMLRWVSVFFYYYFLIAISYVFLRGLLEWINQDDLALVIGGAIMGAIFLAIRPFWSRLNKRLKTEAREP